jgi:hypothetical protein
MYSIWSRITCTIFVSRKGSDTPGFLVLWRGRLQLPKHHAFVTTINTSLQQQFFTHHANCQRRSSTTISSPDHDSSTERLLVIKYKKKNLSRTTLAFRNCLCISTDSVWSSQGHSEQNDHCRQVCLHSNFTKHVH